jgi:hypothetical protein
MWTTVGSVVVAKAYYPITHLTGEFAVDWNDRKEKSSTLRSWRGD